MDTGNRGIGHERVRGKRTRRRVGKQIKEEEGYNIRGRRDEHRDNQWDRARESRGKSTRRQEAGWETEIRGGWGTKYEEAVWKQGNRAIEKGRNTKNTKTRRMDMYKKAGHAGGARKKCKEEGREQVRGGVHVQGVGWKQRNRKVHGKKERGGWDGNR